MIEKKKMNFAIEEFDSAWQEFFEDKSEPKNDEEDKKQQEEFYHWYNFVRKQSDTGKTPAEMYKELYGEDPPDNPIIDNNIKSSRIMNFGWDEEDEKDFADETINYNIPSTDKIKAFFNSQEQDKIKSAYLIKNLIFLDKMHKFPTAKEITLAFFNSNVKKESKVEVANYLLNETYMSSFLLEEFGGRKINNFTAFIGGVIDSVDEELDISDYLGTDFGCVRRGVVFWLIANSDEPKKSILRLFKEKIDWFDFPTQNGILDYCYRNYKILGLDFVTGILDKAVKVNMREVRITALKYAYLLTNNDKYISLIEKDTSSHIRKLAKELKNKSFLSKDE